MIRVNASPVCHLIKVAIYRLQIVFRSTGPNVSWLVRVLKQNDNFICRLLCGADKDQSSVE